MHFRNIFLITRLGAIVTLTTEVIGRTLRRYAVDSLSTCITAMLHLHLNMLHYWILCKDCCPSLACPCKNFSRAQVCTALGGHLDRSSQPTQSCLLERRQSSIADCSRKFSSRQPSSVRKPFCSGESCFSLSPYLNAVC